MGGVPSVTVTLTSGDVDLSDRILRSNVQTVSGESHLAPVSRLNFL